jgi:hypothetical protein
VSRGNGLISALQELGDHLLIHADGDAWMNAVRESTRAHAASFKRMKSDSAVSVFSRLNRHPGGEGTNSLATRHDFPSTPCVRLRSG